MGFTIFLRVNLFQIKVFESESEFSVVRYKFPVTHCLSFSFSCTNLDFAFMGTSFVVVVVVEKFD